jgi:SAM-dependent methyltransferase
MDLVGRAYHRFVSLPRARVLARRLAPLLPETGRVLDVGCGDGALAHELGRLRPALRFEGIDVAPRAASRVAVERFDGRHIPRAAGAVECALLVDVVHHAEDPRALLAEVCRVARQIVIKDHLLEGALAGPTLRFMDRLGNARHGTPLPFHYWRRAEWIAEIESLGLRVAAWQEQLQIYPRPARWLFDRTLHFAARLEARPAKDRYGDGFGSRW